MILRRFAVVLTTVFLLAGTVAGHDYSVADLIVRHPGARATATASVPGVGYLVIENSGADDDRLLGAESPAAAQIELHRTVIEDGVARMRPVPDGVAVPAGAIVELAPGSYHFMLMGLGAPLTAGEYVPLTRRFEGAGEIAVELAVE